MYAAPPADAVYSKASPGAPCEVSAPIAKSILIDAIEALDIKPSNDGYDKVYQWYDTKYYTIPNVIGKSLKDAKKELKLLSFKTLKS